MHKEWDSLRFKAYAFSELSEFQLDNVVSYGTKFILLFKYKINFVLPLSLLEEANFVSFLEKEGECQHFFWETRGKFLLPPVI